MQKPATAPPDGEKNVKSASDLEELVDNCVQPFLLSVIEGIPTCDDDQTDWCHACTDMTDTYTGGTGLCRFGRV